MKSTETWWRSAGPPAAMVLLSFALLVAAVAGYRLLRHDLLRTHPTAIRADGARPIVVTPEQAERYHLLSASVLLDAQGQIGGFCTVTARQGYRSRVCVQTTFSADGTTVAAIRVLEQDETEYLGARIATDSFAAQFAGRLAPLRLWTEPVWGSPIDALSGSTVSSKAVVDAVGDGWAFICTQRGIRTDPVRIS